MAGAIRGITVEIGGNTTKLDKALADVNKRSRDLSSELTQVNKLLKMDPGNTDLLAQKQEILAEAIAETKKKLDTLKSAEAQVQEQFKRGEVSEAQVRALQREIIETTQKLKTYGRAAEETADALDNMGKDSDSAEKGAKDVDKESGKAAKTLDKFSDKADDAGKSGEGLGAKLGEAAKTGIAALATSVTALIGAMVGSAEATREYRTEMGKLDAAFSASNFSGETASATFSTLQGIIGETDQTVEAAQQIALLAESEEDAARWAEQAAGVVGTFGDALQPETFYESANETLKLGEATGAYVQMLEGTGLSVEEFNKGLAACSTEAEKQAYMLSVTESALGEAGKAYRENNAEIIRANEASNIWMETMSQVGAAVEPILTDIKLLGASLLSDLLPGITAITSAFRGMLDGDAGAAENLGTAISGIFSQVLTKITDLAPTVVTVGMSLITSLSTSLISMLPQLVDVGSRIIISILSGLTQAMPQIFSAIGQMIPELGLALQSFLPQLIALTVSLINTLVGQLDQIVLPLISALPGIITSVTSAILENFPILLNGIILLANTLIAYAPVLIEAILPLIPQIITGVCDCLTENLPVLLTAIVDLVVLIATDILPQILLLIGQMIPEIVTSLVVGLGEVYGALSTWYNDLISSIAEWLTGIIDDVVAWFAEIGAETGLALGEMWSSISTWFNGLISDIGSWFSNIIGKVSSWASNMASKARQMATNFVNNITSFFQQLPGKIWTFLQNAASKVVQWGTDAVAKAKTAAKNIFNGIVDGVKSLPDELKSIGTDLVKGLWNGINNMTSWVIGKINGFGDSVLSGIKNFFGIESPSKLMRDQVGKYVAQGIAVGVTDNADDPVNAVKEIGEEMAKEEIDLNGATINRKLTTTFSNAGSSNVTDFSAILSKLDNLSELLKNLQVVLDSGETVGALIEKIDGALVDRYDKLARGW